LNALLGALRTFWPTQSSALPVDLLPMWYDVDEAATLRLLCDELGLSPNGAGPHTRYEGGYAAPFTRNYLDELIKKGDSERFIPTDG